ncbi:SGNH hydrolase-type esterase domain-containing protein [Entophlyctis helioformis]|nr:SGNH hydrolase-type esterase domain-containing protein [Entophlyctis helioformis]
MAGFGTAFTTFVDATRACLQAFQVAPNGFSNAILILGDDTAAGVGDTAANIGAIPGLARHLQYALFKEAKIKQTWHIYSCGVAGSTSNDWLPTRKRRLGQEASQGQTHFERVFAKEKYTAAQVVILLLGFQDGRSEAKGGKEISPEQTVGNISAICKVLLSMGKTVFLCPVPTYGDESVSDALLEQNMRRNEMIQEYIGHGDKDRLLFAGPQIDALNFEYRVPRYYDERDGQHFNAKGYEKFGKDFADVLVNRLVKIEFGKFSKHLGL